VIDVGGRGNSAPMGNVYAMAGEPPAPARHAADEAIHHRAQQLVMAHFDFVWRLLCRLGVPRSDVDDAAQRVFMVATARLTEIPEPDERSFLYGTAVRVAATLRRTTKRRERIIEPGPVDTTAVGPTPHEELERRRALAFLDEVLQELADDLREVFVLCEIEELSAPQVAAIASIPVGTVASRLRRARREFRQHVKRLQAQKARAP
jgi:RNA polymerase sigma-70 factor, ECF subfamily